MECPWWDTVDVNKKLELGNMPVAQNCWKLVFINYSNFDVPIRAYRTVFCTFKKYKRNQYIQVNKPAGPSRASDSFEHV